MLDNEILILIEHTTQPGVNKSDTKHKNKGARTPGKIPKKYPTQPKFLKTTISQIFLSKIFIFEFRVKSRHKYIEKSRNMSSEAAPRGPFR